MEGIDRIWKRPSDISRNDLITMIAASDIAVFWLEVLQTAVLAVTGCLYSGGNGCFFYDFSKINQPFCWDETYRKRPRAVALSSLNRTSPATYQNCYILYSLNNERALQTILMKYNSKQKSFMNTHHHTFIIFSLLSWSASDRGAEAENRSCSTGACTSVSY